MLATDALSPRVVLLSCTLNSVASGYFLCTSVRGPGISPTALNAHIFHLVDSPVVDEVPLSMQTSVSMSSKAVLKPSNLPAYRQSKMPFPSSAKS